MGFEGVIVNCDIRKEGIDLWLAGNWLEKSYVDC